MTGPAQVPASHRDLLDRAGVASLSTIGPDGIPQVTALWYEPDGDVVRISVTTARQKYRNVAARPRATLFLLDPGNPYRTLELRCEVTVSDDPGLETLDRIIRRYGQDPATSPVPRVDRVVLELRPVKVVTNG